MHMHALHVHMSVMRGGVLHIRSHAHHTYSRNQINTQTSFFQAQRDRLTSENIVSRLRRGTRIAKSEQTTIYLRLSTADNQPGIHHEPPVRSQKQCAQTNTHLRHIKCAISQV